jgi:hypothetical protein
MCFLIPGQRKSPGGRLLLVRFGPEQVVLATQVLYFYRLCMRPKGLPPGIVYGTDRIGHFPPPIGCQAIA